MKAALLCAFALVSCATPSAGTKCDAGVAYCSSATAALSCQSGAFVPYACTGPKGCSLGKDRAVMCDQSTGAAPGAPCFAEYEGKGQCKKDGTGYLQCKSGAWVESVCAVGTKCADDGGLSCK